MATKKLLEFENTPINNEDMFITDVPKDIVEAMTKLIYPEIENYFEEKRNND